MLTTADGHEFRLPVPGLRRGNGDYRHDIACVVAEHFHRMVDVQALEEVLQPLSDGAVLSFSHALAARSAMQLNCYCSGNDLTLDRARRLHNHPGIGPALAGEISSRYAESLNRGRELGIDFFDQDMPLAQIEERLAARQLGLISLDWGMMIERGAVKIPFDISDKDYLLRPGETGRPYFYPVVPLVGYDDASMFVHTYSRPFLPIEKAVFDVARRTPRAQHALIFILAGAHGSPEKVTAEVETGAPLLHFPGAFKESVLVPPAPVPRGFDPITDEDVFKAVTEVKPACEASRFGAHSFNNFLESVFLRLAAEDSTGTSVALLEDELCRLYAIFSEAKAKDEAGPAALPAQKLLPMSDGEIREAVGLERESQPIGGQEPGETDIVAVSAAPESLLHYAIRQSRIAYALAMVRSFGARQSALAARGEAEKLDAALNEKMAEIAVEGEQARFARMELLRQSKSWRIINFLNITAQIASEANPVVEALEKRDRDFPMFGPKVLLTCAPGRLYGEGCPPEESSPADTLTLGSNTFIQLSPRGLVFSMLHYDYKWGSLVQDASYSLTEINHACWDAGREGPKACYKLTRAVNLFPALEGAPLIQAVAGLRGEEFLSYVTQRSNWFGPTLLPSKRWLSPVDGAGPATLSLLGEVTKILKGEASALTREADYKQVGSLGFVLNSSYLSNTQGDHLLFTFVKKSVEDGIQLKDVVLSKVGNTRAAKYLAELRRAENMLLAPLLFEEREGGKLALTDQGVDYLIKLFDPGYAYHHTGEDNVALQEMSALHRRNPYHFDVEAFVKRLRLEGFCHP